MNALKIFCLIVMFWIIDISIAQTGLTVTYYDGTTQNFTVETAGKMYFDTNNLYIKTNVSATPTTIPVSIIRKIIFTDVLSTDTMEQNQQKLVLYPNPTNGFFRFSSDEQLDFNLRIFNLKGQLVLEGNYTTEQDIDVSRLTHGIYMVQANGITFKFIKQ